MPRSFKAAGPRRIALVHHIDDLKDKAAGNLRQGFRKALAGLETDPAQLPALIKLIEKAVFDEPVSMSEVLQDVKSGRSRKGQDQQADDEPSILMIPSGQTVHARRRQRRVFASSDLALIIDMLIYRLGRGLHQETDGPASVRPSEEESSQQPEDTPPQVDGHALAKLCRSKVNRLFRRMIAQLELAVKMGKDATLRVIQLAAVLGVAKHLRLRQASFEWLPRGEKLIEAKRAAESFEEAARLLYGPNSRIASTALTEHDQREFDELTSVRALLAWLALDCGVDARSALSRVLRDPDGTRENLIRLAYFLPVITDCSSDDLAREILTDIAGSQNEDSSDRATHHLRWAQQLLKASRKVASTPSSVDLGDIAVPLKVKWVPFSMVVDVQDNKCGLLDLDTGEPRYFAVGYVTRIQGLQLS